MTAPLPSRTTRRGALAAVLVAAVGSGCEVTAPPSPPGADPGQGATGGTTATPQDPDEALVGEVRAELADASLLIGSAIGARPGLRAELTTFATLHARHLRALDGDRPRGRTSPLSGDAAAVRRAVRVREERLRTSLASAAVAAQSGPLAALLASMSAAVAQQLSAGDDTAAS